MTLMDFISQYKNKKIYIYGAGVYGYHVLKYIYATYESTVNIDAIIVSSKYDNYNNIFGVPVKTVNEITNIENAKIIIATQLNTAKKISEGLITNNKCNSENIYLLNDEEYCNIRRINPDYSSEIRQDLKQVQNRINAISYKSGYKGRRQDEARHKEYFNTMKANPDLLKEKIFALTKDMDSESIYEIYRIVDRLHKLVEGKPIVFSAKEVEELTQREIDYKNNIFKLADDLYYSKNFYLPCSNPSISGYFDENWVDKIADLDYLKDKDAIDAGAYIGDTPLIFSKYTNGNIHSFDPDEANINIIKKTASLNPDSRIIPIQAALTDFDGEVQFTLGYGRDSVDGTNCGNGLGTIDNKCDYVSSTLTVTVPAMTIDKYVADNNLKIGFIKTDVEGAEQELLRGALNTIKTQKPTLMISIYHSLSDFFDIKTWIESLNLGYKFTIYRTVVDHSFLNETMLLCEVEENFK